MKVPCLKLIWNDLSGTEHYTAMVETFALYWVHNNIYLKSLAIHFSSFIVKCFFNNTI